MIENIRFRNRLVTLTVVFLLAVSIARADGLPHVGRPAIVVAGDTFSLGDGAEATASLRLGDTRIPLTVTTNDKTAPEGKWLAEVPDGVAPGRYDLVLTTSAAETEQIGAVHVLESFPTSYVLALLRADQVDSTEGTMFSPALLDILRGATPNLVIVLGALTADGQESAYEALDRQFAGLDVPVFYCPNEQESARETYRARYGNPVYPQRFGDDGYLFLGGGLSHVDSIHGVRAGHLYRWRRALRSSRWSIGVATRYGLDWSMREQLVLFADDPLDYLLAGEGVETSGAKVPWSNTRLETFADALSPSLQLIDVSQEQFVPRIVKVTE